ncbi:cytochrome c-type biogenesis protein CcmH [Formicincola oecophyllae]|uniref:Cytochrome c-type biogenesis protein n=1 Tax=Formicincola oecophyllae TaxID=2558361 RepID=A0A4Y6U8H7_9PROT|nr:cytochrome c-type biogenesis protein [Formicincola oecophyllae]QDH13749.1 cytochrome c-type biogenesis protein CcmH [Formicincola oecophyllae]
MTALKGEGALFLTFFLTCAALLAGAGLAGPGLAEAQALDPAQERLPPQQEERVEHLASQLRCPVCQGQSVAESASPLAHDLRAALRRLVREGHPDQAIMAWVEARYGASISLAPSLNGQTALLWGGAGAFAVLCTLGLGLTVKRNNTPRAEEDETERDKEGKLL